MSKEKILVCKPVSSSGYVIPGSLPGKCSQCGCSVWVAPSSWFLLHDNPGLKILCEPCGFTQIVAKRGKIEGITPAQHGEIEEYFKTD